MFRMEFEHTGTGLTARVQGRLAGHFAEEAKQVIVRPNLHATLILDISEVTFVDGSGEEALTWLSHMGATFVAETSYALDICERLRLPLAGNGTSTGGPHCAAK